MNKYDEIMEKIELTEKRRQRILGGITAKIEKEQKRRRNRRTVIRTILPLAVTAAAVLSVLLVLRPWEQIRPNPTPSPSGQVTPSGSPDETPTATPTPPGDTQDWNIYEEVASASELESVYGYPIKTLERTPFEDNGVTYTRYGMRPEVTYKGESLGDIDYDGEEDYVTLSIFQVVDEARQIQFDTEYDVDREITVNGHAVRVRGYEEGIQVADWYNGEYYFLIFYDDFLTEEAVTDMVTQLDR